MSFIWNRPTNVLAGRDVLLGNDPADAAIEANAVVKADMRMNFRRYLFRRAARKYGFYRAFLAAEKEFGAARTESNERGEQEGLGKDVMTTSGLFADIKVVALFCAIVLLAAFAAEGLR